jgi:hypothetical protein
MRGHLQAKSEYYLILLTVRNPLKTQWEINNQGLEKPGEETPRPFN